MATDQTLTNATVTVGIAAKIAKAGDFQDTIQQFSRKLALAFADGTGNGNADILWADSRTLIADATEDIDLNGVLSDLYGDQVDMLNVKAILIINTDTDSTISVMAAAAAGFAGAGFPFNAASEKQNILPGCFYAVGGNGDGWNCVAATSDKITITEESSAAGAYDIVVLGASAATA